jgi:hypothetical protein
MNFIGMYELYAPFTFCISSPEKMPTDQLLPFTSAYSADITSFRLCVMSSHGIVTPANITHLSSAYLSVLQSRLTWEKIRYCATSVAVAVGNKFFSS